MDKELLYWQGKLGQLKVAYVWSVLYAAYTHRQVSQAFTGLPPDLAFDVEH